MYQKLLIKPVLTEKMAIMQERENKYAFIVDKRANKNQIKTLSHRGGRGLNVHTDTTRRLLQHYEIHVSTRAC